MIKILTLLASLSVHAEFLEVAIIDGDTIEFVETGERIRLYGIDSPETDQPYGSESGHGLADRMRDGDFWIRRLGEGKHGRTIAILEYKDSGSTIQARLIMSGLAWVYPQYCDRRECESWVRLQRIARSQRRGLWADDDPIPPWRWRRNR